MKTAVMSDIHGNLAAFRMVLTDVEKFSVNRIVNLGDSIGYGPEPEEVISLMRRKGIMNMLGNHELAVFDRDCREMFTPGALESVDRSIEFLSDESIEYVKNLPGRLIVGGALFVHGSPPDSQTVYLNKMSIGELEKIFKASRFDLHFTGHTHKLMTIGFDGEKIRFFPLAGAEFKLDPSQRYIVNIGSVGQPRDNDRLAKYVIWDSGEKLLRIRRVQYDNVSTAGKIVERGFREIDAFRLLI